MTISKTGNPIAASPNGRPAPVRVKLAAKGKKTAVNKRAPVKPAAAAKPKVAVEQPMDKKDAAKEAAKK